MRLKIKIQCFFKSRKLRGGVSNELVVGTLSFGDTMFEKHHQPKKTKIHWWGHNS